MYYDKGEKEKIDNNEEEELQNESSEELKNSTVNNKSKNEQPFDNFSNGKKNKVVI